MKSGLKLIIFGSSLQYKNHSRPLYNTLHKIVDVELLENDYVPRSKRNNYFITFGYGDYIKLLGYNIPGDRIIYAEHGVCEFYWEDETKVPVSGWGSITFSEVDKPLIHLAPNQRACDIFSRSHRSVVTGVYETDWIKDWKFNRNKVPIVCLSSHWNQRGNVYTSSYFDHYFNKIRTAVCKRLGWELVLHGHPRNSGKLKYRAYSENLRWIKDFKEVVETCDIYICDNSSSIFSFASSHKPVILLNPPNVTMDTTPSFNFRFWEHADIGIHINFNDPIDIIEDKLYNIEDRGNQVNRMIDNVLANFGRSCEVASEAILNAVVSR